MKDEIQKIIASIALSIYSRKDFHFQEDTDLIFGYFYDSTYAQFCCYGQ